MSKTLVASISVIFLLVVPFRITGEVWPGYEGVRHQSASGVEISGTLEVAWEHRFTTFVTIPDAYTWSSGDYQMHSRNIAVYNGMAAVADTDAAGLAYNNDKACVTILNTADGSVLNSVMTAQRDGPYKSMYDACDSSYGEQILAWDPDTGILFLGIGGDRPAFSAVLPVANMAGFQGVGTWQAGIGAYQQLSDDYPDLKSSRNQTRAESPGASFENPPLLPNEWDTGIVFPNRCGHFDVQPGSPWMTIVKSTGHSAAQANTITQKYTGLCAQENWDQYTYAEPGFPVFKMWHGMLVDGDCIYYLGPYAPGATPSELTSTEVGLQVACVHFTPTDQYADSYSGTGYRETAVPDKQGAAVEPVFHYSYETPAGDGNAWNETDGRYRNKACMVDGDGIWIAWNVSEQRSVHLVRATPSLSASYDLGVGAGVAAKDRWPNIALADLGTSKYVVYYLNCAKPDGSNPPAAPVTLTVVNVTDSNPANWTHWTYDLNNITQTGNYPSLMPNEPMLYFEKSRLVVAGKYAYIAWIDDTGSNAALNLAAFDVTAPAPPTSPPVPFSYDLGIPAGGYGHRVEDLAAVDGTIYALVQEADSFNRPGPVTGERVIAIRPQGMSEFTFVFQVLPASGPAQIVAACDASNCATTDPGGITSYEWDYDYDYLSFVPDDSGTVTSHLFDTIGQHTVGLRLTDSTGHSEVRTATVEVTPDQSADQSVTYTVNEECEINSTENVWNDGSTSNGRMRCSGTYGGAYGSGEHSRGYVNFAPVNLSSSYTLVEARLHFNVVRVNNSGPATVHRMDPNDTLTSSSTWADISAMTGYDQDASAGSPVTPLDTKTLASIGSVSFDVTDAVAAWLGRTPYSTPETQTGFLLCVDDNATPGTLDTGSFFAGEKDSFQWDWDPGECYLEIIYNDPGATTPETLSDVRPGLTASESYTNNNPVAILWGSSGPVANVDIQYSASSATGPWTDLATNETNDGSYSWTDSSLVALSSVVESTVWIRVVKTGDTTVNAVSANSFEVTAAGPTYTLDGTATLTGDLTDTNGVTLRLMDGATIIRTATLDGSGAYSFANVSAGTYTYAFEMTGYTFSSITPSSVTVSADATQNVSAAATSSGTPTYTLDGTATVTGDLTDTNGVTLRLMDGATVIRTATLDGSGAYSFANVSAGTYTYAFEMTGYTFSSITPSSVTVSADATQNVSAAATSSGTPTYTLDGTATLTGGLTDTNGVTLRLMQGITEVTSATLGVSGAYSFTVPAGTYSYDLQLTGYTFAVNLPSPNSVAVSGDATQNVTSTATASSSSSNNKGSGCTVAVSGRSSMGTAVDMMLLLLASAYYSAKKKQKVDSKKS